MGVGKTVQSLACSLEYLSDYPMLVICPSALKTVWLQEIGKWLKDVFHKHQVIMLHHGKNLPLIAGIHVKIIIASYEIATSCIKSLHDCQIVICDEAHYLKNSSTHRSEVLVPYLMSRKRVLMLTGTPALAEPKELFNILHILRPDIYVHEHEYCNRYCLMRRNTWSRQMEYHGSKNSAELHYLLKKIMVRRLKS